MARTTGKRANREASIYERNSDGRWTGAVHLGYGSDGRRRRKVVYGPTQASVLAKIAELKRLVRDDLPIPDDKLLTGTYLRRWLESIRADIRPRTYVSYAGHVERLAAAFERTPVHRLTPADVRTFVAATLRSGLSPRTVGYRLGVLRQALGQGVRDATLVRNVAALVAAPRIVREEVRPLSPEQARTFLAAVAGDRMEGLYTTAIALGLRQGEALGLRWGDVSLDEATLSVRVALSQLPKAVRPEGGRRGTRYALVEPKTRRSRRTLVMPDLVVRALREHRRRQLEERLAAGARWRGSWDLVFTTPIGTPLDTRNVTKAFQRALEEAGLPRQRFHDLRHCAASLMVAQGIHPRTVMETLGHATVSMSMDTYSHIGGELQRDAAKRMDALLAVGEN